MSFIYPRTASLNRPTPEQTAGGVQPYGGRSASQEQVIAEGIVCSIQARREGAARPVGLPSDATKATWRVLTPLGAVADGFVHNSDVFVDDLGRRFGVLADYTNSLGGDFYCERLDP